MTSKELRFSIINLVQKTEDPEILQSIYTILKKIIAPAPAEVAGYETDGTPITEDELVKSILEGSREAKAGNKIPFEQLKAEFGLQ